VAISHGHRPLFSHISKRVLTSVCHHLSWTRTTTTPLDLSLCVSLTHQLFPRAAVRPLTDLSSTTKLNQCPSNSSLLLSLRFPPYLLPRNEPRASVLSPPLTPLRGRRLPARRKRRTRQRNGWPKRPSKLNRLMPLLPSRPDAGMNPTGRPNPPQSRKAASQPIQKISRR